MNLSWLENYQKPLIVVYDIVVVEECLHATEEGRTFDESIFLVEFSTKDMGIISAHILARAKDDKEKTKGIGDEDASTSERTPASAVPS